MNSKEGYLKKAIFLGNERKKIAKWKRELYFNRLNSPLFDNELYVSYFSFAVEKIWNIFLKKGKDHLPKILDLRKYINVENKFEQKELI